jgi:hypothetical protein
VLWCQASRVTSSAYIDASTLCLLRPALRVGNVSSVVLVHPQGVWVWVQGSDCSMATVCMFPVLGPAAAAAAAAAAAQQPAKSSRHLTARQCQRVEPLLFCPLLPVHLAGTRRLPAPHWAQPLLKPQPAPHLAAQLVYRCLHLGNILHHLVWRVPFSSESIHL